MPLFRRRASQQKATSEAEGIPFTMAPGTSMERDVESQVAAAYAWGMRQTPAQIWDNQPYVRLVVDFLARNVAHLGLHAFRRVADNDRRRERDSAFARALREPSTEATQYELLYGLAADELLYDRAYWLVQPGRPSITRLPAAWVTDHIASQANPFAIDGVVATLQDGRQAVYDRSQVVPFIGWSPVDPAGTPEPPLHSLKNVIAEQAAAYEFRARTWDNGLNTNRYVTRPEGAPPWSDAARERFLEDLRATFAKKGNRQGGTPLLEEGMQIHSERFQAREAEWVEGVKLSLQLVAAAYHVNPSKVGLLENTNYSNAVEFRRELYVDTLGPTLAQFEQRINQFVRPLLNGDDEEYCEFNIAEKLEGSFTEQASALQTSVGAPWMTRSEARARMNLPPVEGDAEAEELIVPMNVSVGGLAAPNDTAPPAQASAGVELKARPSEQMIERAQREFARLFERQGQALRSRAGTSSGRVETKQIDDVYSDERWRREIGQVLTSTGLTAATETGRATMERLGQNPDSYDEGRTQAYWDAKSSGLAEPVSDSAKARWAEAVSGDRSFDDVAEVMTGWYSQQLAQSHITDAAGFGTTEAPNQLGREAMKTWQTTSGNPRSEHATLNGETVPQDQPFSNGAMWPGDSSLSADQRAGCHCIITVAVR